MIREPAGQDLGRLQGRLNTPLNLTGLGTSEVTSAVRSAGNTLGDVGAAGGTIAYNIQRYGVRSLTDVLKKQGTFDDVSSRPCEPQELSLTQSCVLTRRHPKVHTPKCIVK